MTKTMVPTKKTTTSKPAAKKAAPKKPAAKKAAPKKPAAKKKAVEKAPVVAAVSVAVAAEPVKKAAAPKADKGYIYALGRRKSAIAQVRLFADGKGEFSVNGKKFDEYFNTFGLRETAMAALKAVGQDNKVDIQIKAYGGGLSGQAVAARLGISRALIKMNDAFRGTLKKMGFLMRDPREKERKKYGFKKARKGPQWAKR